MLHDDVKGRAACTLSFCAYKFFKLVNQQATDEAKVVSRVPKKANKIGPSILEGSKLSPIKKSLSCNDGRKVSKFWISASFGLETGEARVYLYAVGSEA